MHPDVVGAAKLNLLREYGKIGGSLAEGNELTEAEVQFQCITTFSTHNATLPKNYNQI